MNLILLAALLQDTWTDRLDRILRTPTEAPLISADGWDPVQSEAAVACIKAITKEESYAKAVERLIPLVNDGTVHRGGEGDMVCTVIVGRQADGMLRLLTGHYAGAFGEDEKSRKELQGRWTEWWKDHAREAAGAGLSLDERLDVEWLLVFWSDFAHEREWAELGRGPGGLHLKRGAPILKVVKENSKKYRPYLTAKLDDHGPAQPKFVATGPEQAERAPATKSWAASQVLEELK